MKCHFPKQFAKVRDSDLESTRLLKTKAKKTILTSPCTSKRFGVAIHCSRQ